MHFRNIEKYAEENGYKAYTAVRRLQEARDPKDPYYDPGLHIVEENGTIKFYVYTTTGNQYGPVKASETQDLPRREEIQSPPAQNYQAPPKSLAESRATRFPPKQPRELSAREKIEIYEEERKRLGRPLTTTEYKKAIEFHIKHR